ncbi:MAG: HVO_0476 family zinc finger protein [Halobacteriales archaeon]
MNETRERVAVACPACSPDLETVHEVLKPGGQATVRCTECDHVHKVRLPADDRVERDVVVSQDGDSFSATADVPPEETLAVGEEFVLESEEGVFTVRITSLEVGDSRVDAAPGEEVDTIWTRDVGNVAVNVTLHPKQGSGDRTKSLDLPVPGDHEFAVGETEEFGEEEFTVQKILVREDARGYDFESLDHEGDLAIAKDVKRLYARDETADTWTAW